MARRVVFISILAVRRDEIKTHGKYLVGKTWRGGVYDANFLKKRLKIALSCHRDTEGTEVL
jgi:hypothetical protein